MFETEQKEIKITREEDVLQPHMFVFAASRFHFGHGTLRWNMYNKEEIVKIHKDGSTFKTISTLYRIRKGFAFLLECLSVNEVFEVLLVVYDKVFINNRILFKQLKAYMAGTKLNWVLGWIPGFLSNFRSHTKHLRIQKRFAIKCSERKRQQREIAFVGLKKYLKTGKKRMTGSPDFVVFMSSAGNYHEAVKEGVKLKMGLINIVDSDALPDSGGFTISSNDDASSVTFFFIGILNSVMAVGHARREHYFFENMRDNFGRVIKKEEKPKHNAG
jgi:ribosomal protein S2